MHKILINDRHLGSRRIISDREIPACEHVDPQGFEEPRAHYIVESNVSAFRIGTAIRNGDEAASFATAQRPAIRHRCRTHTRKSRGPSKQLQVELTQASAGISVLHTFLRF